MNSDCDGIDDGRRAFMKTLAIGATAGGLAAAGARPAAAATDLSGWFQNTANATEVVDETGQSEVTVEVGTDGNGAAFGYGPAVVRVDPGTTVVWEWTGEGSPHNVVADDGGFESEMISDAGATFEHVFESAGVTKYYCGPHKTMGMKGAVVVGDAEVTLPGGGSAGTDAPGGANEGGNGTAGGGAGTASVSPDYGDWFDNVGNFDGTVDRTGEDEVRIEVGAEGNGSSLAFSPPAVHVDPGTTVVWEWTGQGGGHNVYSEAPAFESPTKSEEGATYALEFEGEGVCKYACAPHEGAGMKGAVVVGNPAAGGGGGLLDLETALWGLAGAIVAAPFVASEVVARRRRKDEQSGGRPGHPAD